ncbi:hypothetical protein ATO13_21331 [Stappia sp. 22II-S9-Z10]|nr:hypothetical protein ATO13_21331 [Stappia sp. 22II-S9-Z10]
MRREGIEVARDTVARLMKEMGIALRGRSNGAVCVDAAVHADERPAPRSGRSDDGGGVGEAVRAGEDEKPGALCRA